jgi:hypothetical protein
VVLGISNGTFPNSRLPLGKSGLMLCRRPLNPSEKSIVLYNCTAVALKDDAKVLPTAKQQLIKKVVKFIFVFEAPIITP